MTTRGARHTTPPSLPAGTESSIGRDDGESERFVDLQEAQVFAKSLWESQGRHHVIVIKDKTEGDRIVQAFKAEPHDTRPETSADETQRVQVVPLGPQK